MQRTWQIDPSWTLFLDRDGVINEKLEGDYVKHWGEFRFLPLVLEAVRKYGKMFGRIVITTNQQGVGKGLMTESDLSEVHKRMMEGIEAAGGRIDKIYHCPDLRSKSNNCRKPGPAMALKAKADFPEIDFSRSIMVGDSLTDMEFGKSVGMWTVWIADREVPESHTDQIDLKLSSLPELLNFLKLV